MPRAMIDVVSRGCAHVVCTQQPKYNCQATRRGVPQETRGGVHGGHDEQVRHPQCTGPKSPKTAVLIERVGATYNGDFTEGLAINFDHWRKVADVKGCRRLVQWGVRDEQPTLCGEHGARRASNYRGTEVRRRFPEGTQNEIPPNSAERVGGRVGRKRGGEGGDNDG